MDGFVSKMSVPIQATVSQSMHPIRTLKTQEVKFLLGMDSASRA